jgi:hypothetical protein
MAAVEELRMAKAVFKVRKDASSATLPLMAADSLKEFLNEHVPNSWEWDVPRWQDCKLTTMAVKIASDEEAAKCQVRWQLLAEPLG